MNRDDVLKVDELKEELTSAFRQFEQSLRAVFGDLVYAVDTVGASCVGLIERYNTLENKHTQLEARMDQLSERLLALERLRGEH